MFHSNLFLFSLCSALFSFFVSLSSFPVVFGHSTIERGGGGGGRKEAETTARNSLCGFSPLLLVKPLIWKSCPCCSSHFSTPAVHFETAARPFTLQSPICLLGGPCFFSVWTCALPPWHLLLRFSREHNRTQIARGNLKWEALKRRWEKKKKKAVPGNKQFH